MTSRARSLLVFGLLAFGLNAACLSKSTAEAKPSDRLKAVGDPKKGAEVYPLKVAGNRAPVIGDLPIQDLHEGIAQQIRFSVSDPDQDALRVYLSPVPPGAVWKEATRELAWTPNFIQGGRDYPFMIVATDGKQVTQRSYRLRVKDSIHPPDPVEISRKNIGHTELITLRQTTDAFLDSPGYAGRSFEAVIGLPPKSKTRSLPVHVQLHAYAGRAAPWAEAGRLYVAPHDKDNSFWWGYDQNLPQKPADGQNVPPYTARRVLHLLDFALRQYGAGDPERVYVEGWSMGGAGALNMGLLWARHFAWADARVGQVVPRFHRKERIENLSQLWGPPPPPSAKNDRSAWDQQDLTRALLELPEAREAYLSLHHGKDDPLTHFGALMRKSPLTQAGFYQSLDAHHVGYLASWDEGGHTEADPVLGRNWWETPFNPITDPSTQLRRDRAFPAFSRASHNGDYGNGEGNGKRPYSPSKGYAGNPKVPGDNGWAGDNAGVLNRLLRWKGESVKDDYEHFEVAIFVKNTGGKPPPRPGYPSRGDRLDVKLPVRADVTPRRLQRFQVMPGERIRWQYGKDQGEVRADATGSVTIPQLSIGNSATTLKLSRVDGPRIPS